MTASMLMAVCAATTNLPPPDVEIPYNGGFEKLTYVAEDPIYANQWGRQSGLAAYREASVLVPLGVAPIEGRRVIQTITTGQTRVFQRWDNPPSYVPDAGPWVYEAWFNATADSDNLAQVRIGLVLSASVSPPAEFLWSDWTTLNDDTRDWAQVRLPFEMPATWPGAMWWAFQVDTPRGNVFVDAAKAYPVAEPASVWLVGVAGVGLLGAQRRRMWRNTRCA